MKSKKKLITGTVYGSSGKVGIVKRDAVSGRSMKQVGLYLCEAIPKVYAGPFVEGKGLKLVEVVSGNVVDRKPSML